MNKLYKELEIYEDLRINATSKKLALKAKELALETLAQIWAKRKQIENNNKKGLYFVESEPIT